jgi:hypothetical protein
MEYSSQMHASGNSKMKQIAVYACDQRMAPQFSSIPGAAFDHEFVGAFQNLTSDGLCSAVNGSAPSNQRGRCHDRNLQN